MKKRTNEELILELKSIYGDKFDYSKTVYKGSNKPFIVTCPVHGDLTVRYDHFVVNKLGCVQCKKEEQRKQYEEDFLKRAKEIHGDKYDYSLVKYVNSFTKVNIICKKHGIFQIAPSNHVNAKQGCVKCYNESRTGNYDIDVNEFIKRAKETHGDKYDYSQSVYRGMKEKINIICPKHGEFWQVAYDHLRGFKCAECKHEEDRLTKEQFIEKAKKIHGDKYDYSLVKYINNHTKVKIICPEHGEFEQEPSHHLLGMGCHYCTISRLENALKLRLERENINFIYQYRKKWLGRLSLDFYLPDHNIAIECQGIQHYKPIPMWGGTSQFKRQVERDERKRKLCEENNVNLLYFTNVSYSDSNYIDITYKNMDDLIKKIRMV